MQAYGAPLTREALARLGRDAGLASDLAEAERGLAQSGAEDTSVQSNSEPRDAGQGRSAAEAEPDGGVRGALDGNGTDAVKSGRIKQAMDDLLGRLQKTLDASDKADAVNAVLKRVVAETSMDQSTQVTDLQRSLERARRASKAEDSERRRLASQAEALEGRLEAALHEGAEAAQELDNQHDRAKGLEARHAQRIRCLREEFTEELQTQEQKFEHQLAEAEGALRFRQDALEGARAFTGDGRDAEEAFDDQDEERRKLTELEAVVMSSRETQNRLTDELSELRLQVLGMDPGDEARDDDMQQQLWQAQQQLLHDTLQQQREGHHGDKRGSGSGRRGVIHKMPPQRQPGNKLTAIQEEDEDSTSVAGSAAASGHLSGVDSSEIGNLQDFDEDDDEAPPGGRADQAGPHEEEHLAAIEHLKSELAQSRIEKSELKEDLAGREAELDSKVQRLTQLLRISRQGEAEMASLKESMAGGGAEPSQDAAAAAATPDQAKQESAAGEHQAGRPNDADSEEVDVEALKHELFLATEAKRIAGNRAEDMRQELEATQRRCEQTAADLRLLRQKNESMKGPASEVKDLTQRLSKVEEERNVLQHTLEWKEVQWQSKMEHLELEHAELKRRLEGEVDQLKTQLDETVLDFKRKLDAADQEKAALSRAGVAAGGPAAAPGGVGGLLALLRCPARMSDPSSQSFSSGASGAAHCREVGWQLLGLVPKAIALLCEVPGLRVLDLTDGAKGTWGETLAGSLVLTLLVSPSSAAWLRRAIVTHQNLAALEGSPGEVPGFAVHTLGQLEMRDGNGRPFEAAVTVAHLPSEPKLGKAASVIVLIEPARAPQPSRPGGSRRSAMGGGSRAGSAVRSLVGGASVVSDDVLPCDSASNVAARYM